MKKYFTIILAVIIFILSLVNGWFLDQIVDRSIFWGFVPSVLLIILFIICFKEAIKNLKEYKSRFAAFSLILLFLNINAVLFIPFRSIRVNVDFKIFNSERKMLIEQIKDYKIIPDKNGEVKINSMYSGISSNRKLYIYEQTDDNVAVGFCVSENMPFKSAMLIYTDKNSSYIKEILDVDAELDIKIIEDNWYYVEYEK